MNRGQVVASVAFIIASVVVSSVLMYVAGNLADLPRPEPVDLEAKYSTLDRALPADGVEVCTTVVQPRNLLSRPTEVEVGDSLGLDEVVLSASAYYAGKRRHAEIIGVEKDFVVINLCSLVVRPNGG